MSRTILTKTETVLILSGATEKTATFARIEELGESRDYELRMDRALWSDLGAPDEITVSIEPGDRLND